MIFLFLGFTLRSRHCSQWQGRDMWELSSSVLSEIGGTCSLLLSSVVVDDLPNLSPTLLLRSLREKFCIDFSRDFVIISMFGAFIFLLSLKSKERGTTRRLWWEYFWRRKQNKTKKVRDWLLVHARWG